MTTVRPEIGLTIERLAGRIGAEIGGVDTGDELDDQVIAEIRDALLAHRVVFFRDQHPGYDRQVAFAQRFGPLTLGHPTLPSPASQPFLEEFDSATGAPANRRHTDVTFCDRPPAFTFLHGVVMPEVGGDSIWANTVAAYDSQPAEGAAGLGRRPAHRPHKHPRLRQGLQPGRGRQHRDQQPSAPVRVAAVPHRAPSRPGPFELDT